MKPDWRLLSHNYQVRHGIIMRTPPSGTSYTNSLRSFRHTSLGILRSLRMFRILLIAGCRCSRSIRWCTLRPHVGEQQQTVAAHGAIHWLNSASNLRARASLVLKITHWLWRCISVCKHPENIPQHLLVATSGSYNLQCVWFRNTFINICQNWFTQINHQHQCVFGVKIVIDQPCFTMTVPV